MYVVRFCTCRTRTSSSPGRASPGPHWRTGYASTASPPPSSSGRRRHGPAARPSTCAAPDAPSWSAWGSWTRSGPSTLDQRGIALRRRRRPDQGPAGGRRLRRRGDRLGDRDPARRPRRGPPPRDPPGHRVPVRRHDHRNRPGRRRRHGHLREGGAAPLRAGHRRRRAALDGPGARLRPGVGRGPSDRRLHRLVHRARRHRSRRLVPDAQRPRRARGVGPARPAPARDQGRPQLPLGPDRLRPPRHRPAAGHRGPALRAASDGRPRGSSRRCTRQRTSRSTRWARCTSTAGRAGRVGAARRRGLLPEPAHRAGHEPRPRRRLRARRRTRRRRRRSPRGVRAATSRSCGPT